MGLHQACMAKLPQFDRGFTDEIGNLSSPNILVPLFWEKGASAYIALISGYAKISIKRCHTSTVFYRFHPSQFTLSSSHPLTGPSPYTSAPPTMSTLSTFSTLAPYHIIRSVAPPHPHSPPPEKHPSLPNRLLLMSKTATAPSSAQPSTNPS